MKTALILAITFMISNDWQDSTKPQPAFPLSVDLETIDGRIINSSTLANDKKILVLDFWITNCPPCIMSFNAIRDNYDEWKAKTGTKIIAIAAQKRDDKALELIRKSEWPFEVYFDPSAKLFIASSRAYQKGPVELAFPTMFVLNEEYQFVDKMVDAKMKVINGVRLPAPDEPVIGGLEDHWEIDLEQYYEYFKEIRERK